MYYRVTLLIFITLPLFEQEVLARPGDTKETFTIEDSIKIFKVLARKLLQILFFVGIFHVIAETSLADNKHPYNVEDLLKRTIFGAIKFDPTGQRILISKSLSYEDITDFAAIPLAGATYHKNLYSVTLGETGPPLSLFKEDPNVGYWSTVFSPDGQRLIIYRMQSRKVDVGVFDFKSHQTIWIPYAPYFSTGLPTKPVWISNDEFIVAAMPPGKQPISITRKLEVANRLFVEWEKAWRGKLPTAHVMKSSKNGIDQAEQFKSGLLIKVDARSGNISRMSYGLYSGLQLSPDRRYLAALKTAGQLQPDPDRAIIATSPNKNRLQLNLFDLKNDNERTIPCAKCDVYPKKVAWSADGKRLVFFTRKLKEHWDEGQFFQYEIETRSASFITHAGLDLAPASSSSLMAAPDPFAWIGNKLAVFARPVLGQDSEKSFSNWASITDRTEIKGPLKLGRGDWFFIDLDGKHTNLTSSFKEVSHKLLSVTKDAIFIFAEGNVWRIAEDGIHHNVTKEIKNRVSFSKLTFTKDTDNVSQLFNSKVILQSRSNTGEEIILLDLKEKNHSILKFPSNDANLLAVSFETKAALLTENFMGSSTLYVTSFKGSKKTDKHFLMEINSHLKNVVPMKEQKITYDYKEGNKSQKLTSCMTLPPHWKEGERYPVVIVEYLGSYGKCGYSIFDRFFSSHNMSLLAAQGYIILYASNPVHLNQSPDGHPMGNLADVVLSAVDAVVDQGYADPDRIGIYGESYGGFPTLWLLSRTDRFKAAIAGNSPANFTSYYGSKSLTERVVGADNELPPYLATMTMLESNSSRISLHGSKPWEDPEKYINISPLFFADKITTPVMLLHGDLDLTSSDQFHEMFSALYRLRKEAIFVEYWGEVHGTASPANIRDRWRRIIYWYDKYLKK